MSIDPKTYEYAPDVLKDRIILITGATDGIGRVLALHAAGLGAQVLIHGRSTKKLEKLHDEIEAIERIELETGKRIEAMENAAIFPANLYIAPRDRLNDIIHEIQDELHDQEKYFEQIKTKRLIFVLKQLRTERKILKVQKT